MHQHRLGGTVRAIVIAGGLAIAMTSAFAQTPADNTKVNKRDRAKGASPPINRRRP